jgi:hypothetical protein
MADSGHIFEGRSCALVWGTTTLIPSCHTDQCRKVSPVTNNKQRPNARRVGTMARAIHERRIVCDDRDFEHIQDPNA